MKLRNFVALSALAGIGGYWYYTHGLSDEQRTDIEARVERVRATVSRVREQLKPLVDEAVHSATTEADHTNKERTRRQWESLGF